LLDPTRKHHSLDLPRKPDFRYVWVWLVARPIVGPVVASGHVPLIELSSITCVYHKPLHLMVE